MYMCIVLTSQDHIETCVNSGVVGQISSPRGKSPRPSVRCRSRRRSLRYV